jgi:hypothetical protein
MSHDSPSGEQEDIGFKFGLYIPQPPGYKHQILGKRLVSCEILYGQVHGFLLKMSSVDVHDFTTLIQIILLHVTQWIKTGIGLVTGLINHLQAVTRNKYNTIADLHNLPSRHINLLSLFPLVFTIHFLATDL